MEATYRLLFTKQEEKTDKNNTKYTHCTQEKSEVEIYLKHIWFIIEYWMPEFPSLSIFLEQKHLKILSSTFLFMYTTQNLQFWVLPFNPNSLSLCYGYMYINN